MLKKLLTLNFKTNEKIRNFANGKFAGGNVNWKCVGAAFMLGLGVGLIETGAGAVIAGIGGSYYYDKCSFGG